MIILYSTHCPRCKVMEMKLKQKNLDYRIESDTDIVTDIGKKVGIMSAPIVKIDDEYYDFTDGIKKINELN